MKLILLSDFLCMCIILCIGACLLVLVRLVAARRRRNICINPKWVILELKVFH